MDPMQTPVCMTCEQRQPFTPDQPAGVLRCGLCGSEVPAEFSRFVLVTGASGSGKSTVMPLLRASLRPLRRHVVLDADLLLHLSEPNWARWCNDWLLLAFGLAQSGQTLVLCGAIDPAVLEDLPARTLVASIDAVVLDCSDDVRTRRLRERPPWRRWTPTRIGEMLRMAETLRHGGRHRMDTTDMTPQAVADELVRLLELS